MQTIRMMAYNPTTRKMEEVYPESEVQISEMAPRFLCAINQKWVSIPGITAEEVYDEWFAQISKG